MIKTKKELKEYIELLQKEYDKLNTKYKSLNAQLNIFIQSHNIVTKRLNKIPNWIKKIFI